MSYLSDLQTRRSAIAAELAALTSAKAGGKPNSGGVSGGSIDHVGYKDGLYRELAQIDELLKGAGAAAAAADNAENGPWEIET